MCVCVRERECVCVCVSVCEFVCLSKVCLSATAISSFGSAVCASVSGR